MRTIKSILTLAFLMAAFVSVNAQAIQTIAIKTSSQCEMCEAKLEKNIAFEKGVTAVDLDIATQILTVSFKGNKNTPDGIKKAVTMLGYDADEMVADSDAYSKLPDCCKKPVAKKSTAKAGCGSTKPSGCGGCSGSKAPKR